MATVSMEPKAPEAARAADPTIGRLVNNALEDVSALIRNEIALAKSEITFDVKKAGIGIGMFAGAAFVGVLGVIFLLHTAAQGLIALGLAAWLSYLIVTLVLFVIAGILALIGKAQVSKVQGKPKRTIETTKSTIDTVKSSASGDATAGIRRADPVAHGAAETTPVRTH